MTYDDFLQMIPLSPQHRDQLKRDRGFSDETIDRLGFRSGGKSVGVLIANLKDRKALRSLKILEKGNYVNEQLLKDRVIIPYRDRGGVLYKVRVHKLGFKGDPASLYYGDTFDENSEHLIFTEGEFKAVAAMEYGFSSIATPGISTFSGKKFDELIDFLSTTKVKKITILYDREIKNDKAFKNYKPDWRNRFDTEIYSFIMAQRLEKAGFDARVAELPDSWMVQGKADIDGALAMGKTREEFASVVDGSVKAKEYLEVLKARTKSNEFYYIKQRTQKAFYNPKIVRHFGIYKTTATKPKDLSNFVIEFVSKYYDVEEAETVRFVMLKSKYGDVRGPVELRSACMVSKTAFRKFLYDTGGNFSFEGNDNDLNAIIDYEMMCTEIDKEIVQLSHCGRVDHPKFRDLDIWLFKNVGFVDDREIYPDGSGIFWVTEKTGIKVTTRMEGAPIPELCLEQPDLDGIREAFWKMGRNRGKMELGGDVFNLISHYSGDRAFFPIAFHYGKRGSGKTSMCRASNALMGLYDFQPTLTDVSAVAFIRMLGFYSNICAWFDEYTNNAKIMRLEPLIKSAYNKQSSFRGTKRQDELKSLPVRAPMKFSSESVPTTEGVRNRCVLLHAELMPDGLEGLGWIEENVDKLSSFLYYVVKNRVSLGARVKELIAEIKEENKTVTEFRLLDHTAAFVAGYEALFGPDPAFRKWAIEKYIPEENEEIEETSELMLFCQDLLDLKEQKRIQNFSAFAYKSMTSQGEPIVCLAMGSLYSIWVREMKNIRTDIHSQRVLISTLKNERYYKDQANLRFNGVARRCHVLSYDLCPGEIRALVDEDNDLTNEVYNDDEEIPF